MNIPAFPDTRYALTRALPGVPFADAVARTRAALATQGFGVITEIDFRATLKAKLGVEVRDYVILGACNPALAHRALQVEPGAGLLLPCNVVVSADDAGGSIVAAVDPMSLFAAIGKDDLEAITREVQQRLNLALDALDVR